MANQYPIHGATYHHNYVNYETENHRTVLPSLIFHHHNDVERMLKETVQMNDLDKPISPSDTDTPPIIIVRNIDSVDAAREMVDAGIKHPLILNMANHRSPGSGQEGCLMKQLALALPLEDYGGLYSNFHPDKELYPIPETGAIYSPYVPVLRESEWNGHKKVYTPNADVQCFDVLSVAAVNSYSFVSKRKENYLANACKVAVEKLEELYFKPLREDLPKFLGYLLPKHHQMAIFLHKVLETDEGRTKLMKILLYPPINPEVTWQQLSSALYVAGNQSVYLAVKVLTDAYIKDEHDGLDLKIAMHERIRGIFRASIRTGHRDLVLGAFGCGVFGNEPYTIATLFKTVIEEKEFVGFFDQIFFAVTEGKNSYSVNEKIFEKVLMNRS